ncbi:MAG: heavy-metal-associated domain-containing protein, partial [Chloroflexi bacterium]|nr:heavy-metal-associated domain-containing protein [Chloroflexota bacterium]
MRDTKVKKTSLPIGGMTCASCVVNVQTALKEVHGVKEAVVNLAMGKAAVEYDPSEASLSAMKKAVDEIGYEVVLATANLQVTGMTCASCVENI